MASVIITVLVVGGLLYWLIGMGGVNVIQNALGSGSGTKNNVQINRNTTGNSSSVVTTSKAHTPIINQGNNNNMTSFIQNAIKQAGGDPNGSFQNLRINRTINTGGSRGVHQSVNQTQHSSNLGRLSYN